MSTAGWKPSVFRYSSDISAAWTFGNRIVPVPSRESSCFRPAAPSASNERSARISVRRLVLHIEKTGLDALV
jgi:hypothetical protein